MEERTWIKSREKLSINKAVEMIKLGERNAKR
jgi:hypothetical protein